ncbi:hypothetical protein KI387_022457, partial [Taxus chinensis]
EQAEEDVITLVECLTKMKVGKGILQGNEKDKDKNEGGVGEASTSRKNECVGDPN